MKVTSEQACEAQDTLDSRGHRLPLQDIHEALQTALDGVPSPSEELKARLADALWAHQQAEAKLSQVREWLDGPLAGGILTALQDILDEE